MDRRKFIGGLAVATVAPPLLSYAQPQARIWRVGFLSQRGRADSPDANYYRAFPLAMRELGYIEGKNVVIEWRFADGGAEHLRTLAAELVQLKMDVIVTPGTPATMAAQQATMTIPIVMTTVGDPVGSRIVTNLARPSANVTGLASMDRDFSPKLLEMLREMARNLLLRVAVLSNPDNPQTALNLAAIQRAAQESNSKILPVEARTAQGIEEAFSAMTRQKAEAVIVVSDSYLNQQYRKITELAAQHRLLSVSTRRQYVDAGFLMSYGPDSAEGFRRAATYVDKIFKGAKPGDLPIEQPTKFELIIDLKTAKVLGLTIPQSLLLRADELIQ
jgi:putative tryptophan/tyrosine transport system substrate-binding protein